MRINKQRKEEEEEKERKGREERIDTTWIYIRTTIYLIIIVPDKDENSNITIT